MLELYICTQRTATGCLSRASSLLLVVSLCWEPLCHPRLSVLTSSASPRLFLWSPLGAVVVRLPAPASGEPFLLPASVRWNPRGGGAMCLVAKEGFICSKIAPKKTGAKERYEGDGPGATEGEVGS